MNLYITEIQVLVGQVPQLFQSQFRTSHKVNYVDTFIKERKKENTPK